MKTFYNPFRSRASEQERDTLVFLRRVGAGVVDLLPDSIWDRPLLIRSASGGGKTTLLRIFESMSVATAVRFRDDLPELSERLIRVGAATNEGPTRLGVRLNLRHDYQTVASCGAPSRIADRLFFRLLDARIAMATVRAALARHGLEFPTCATQVEIVPDNEDDRAVLATHRLGGTNGAAIVGESIRIQTELASLFDSLQPVDWTSVTAGHAELYSLRMLSTAQIFVNGEPAPPVHLMLDDGHALTDGQRSAVLNALINRELQLPRWFAERLSALDATEVLGDETSGRDYELLELEKKARQNAGIGSRRFDRLLHDVGNLRAAWHLEQYTHGQREFFQYLDDAQVISETVLHRIRTSAVSVAADDRLYCEWIEQADHGPSYTRAIQIRAAEIAIERHLRRPQLELFDNVNAPTLGHVIRSDVREAARLFLSKEYKLPYYAGVDIISRVSSENVEQFLRVCGDLFEFMLGRVILGEPADVNPSEQDRIIRGTSTQLWQELPERLPRYRDVITLVNRIAQISHEETYRATAPYSPGVNGIAMSMEDRSTLLDPSGRKQIMGAQRLFEALAAAIARNVIIPDVNYAVKRTRVMVLYLNRLLCPRLRLPVQRGSFRERRLSEIAGWLAEDDPTIYTPDEALFEA